MITRRYFLRSSGIGVVGIGIAPSWLLHATTLTAQTGSKRKVLVAIFQRGAADGLNIVAPFFEKSYYEMRPTIAVPPPGKENGGIDLDGRFALHPSLQPLKALWDRGQLAIIHATGSPDPTRSHFDAQDFMESGTPGKIGEDGWLNRALAPESVVSPLRAIAIGAQLPRTLRGSRQAVAINNLQQFEARNNDVAGILEGMYATTSDARLLVSGKETFEAVRMIKSINRSPYSPANGAKYQGGFGNALQQIARLIKADAGVEAAFADIGGWDHHINEAPQLANLLIEYGASLGAFAQDMGDRMSDIVLVTMSEFGRTAREDGNAGTDHGHGNVMMVLGGPVRGGKVYGRWPGLSREELYEERDLAVTTDFRQVLGELVSRHLGRSRDQVFADYKSGEILGLIAS
jgi:uncharacterized protein (DUF1501 family)